MRNHYFIINKCLKYLKYRVIMTSVWNVLILSKEMLGVEYFEKNIQKIDFDDYFGFFSV